MLNTMTYMPIDLPSDLICDSTLECLLLKRAKRKKEFYK